MFYIRVCFTGEVGDVTFQLQRVVGGICIRPLSNDLSTNCSLIKFHRCEIECGQFIDRSYILNASSKLYTVIIISDKLMMFII